MNRSERQVRYNHIEDIKMEQGIFGTIFGFGTVLPLTGSGLGTGTDESMVAGGTGTEVKGMSFGIGGAARNCLGVLGTIHMIASSEFRHHQKSEI